MPLTAITVVVEKFHCFSPEILLKIFNRMYKLYIIFIFISILMFF